MLKYDTLIAKNPSVENFLDRNVDSSLSRVVHENVDTQDNAIFNRWNYCNF